MLCAYLGNAPMSYPDYRDAGTGRMLYAAPGGTYDVLPASSPAPLPPNDGRWEPAGPPPPPPDNPPGDGEGTAPEGDPAGLLAELEAHETPAEVAAQLEALAAGETPETPAPEGAPAPESEA